MDLTMISTFVQNVGVTAAVLVAACYYIKYQTDNYRADIERLNNLHKEEMDAVTAALNNNTAVLTRLETILAGNSANG